MNYAGPYTPWIHRHHRAVQLFGRQFVRTVSMGDGRTKQFHCVLMRSGNNAQVRVPGLAWDARHNRIITANSKFESKESEFHC